MNYGNQLANYVFQQLATVSASPHNVPIVLSYTATHTYKCTRYNRSEIFLAVGTQLQEFNIRYATKRLAKDSKIDLLLLSD